MSERPIPSVQSLAQGLFPRHAFDDIVDGGDQSVRTVPGGSGYEGFRQDYGLWDRAHWERALARGAADLSRCNYLVDEQGIWLRKPFPWESNDGFLTWHPQAELEQGADPRESPVLPFPFSGRQLAAYFAGGPGWFMREGFVACLHDAQNDVAAASKMMVADPNSVVARRALQAAWVAWREASANCRFDPMDVPKDGVKAMVRLLLGRGSPDSSLNGASSDGVGTQSKLNEKQRTTIRARLKKGETVTALARAFGVSRRTIDKYRPSQVSSLDKVWQAPAKRHRVK